MSYNSSTFIAPYNASTDTSIVILDSDGNRVAGLNVSRITKVASQDKVVLMVLESGGADAEFTLEFSSINEASLAQIALTTAINTLYTNAIKLGLGVTIVNPPQTILSRTLAQYVTAANGGTLVPLQWYSISDAGNTFGIGTSYNVQALANNDSQPFGIVPSTRLSFQIDVLNTVLLSKNDPDKKESTINGATIVSDNLSQRLYATNNSIINATNSSDIEAYNSSTLTVVDCEKVIAKNGAVVNIEGVSNVEIDGINVNIGAALADKLSNVKINKHTSLGAWEWPPEDLATATSFEAYSDPINYQINSALSTNLVIPIKNKFVEANAEFRFDITPGYIGNYTITVQDEALSTLLVIDKAYEGATIVFRWDQTNSDWLLAKVENLQVKNAALIPSIDGQTTFALPTKAIEPTKARFYIQGQLQSYGMSKDYYITNNILTYNALSYPIKSTDSLEVFYI